jgi:hypothetical protein
MAYELFCSAVLQLSLFSYAVMTLRKLGWKEGLSLVESGVLCDLIRWETMLSIQNAFLFYVCPEPEAHVCFPMQCWK